MAIIDDTRGVLVVRIVYDGPALSGKTTSLQALARGISRKLECPAEKAGRTLFFDWVDYVGGLFDGRQIRCQIVSVPGQRDLSQRRKLLLETADAVVLVLDTRQAEWDFALGWVSELATYCRARDPAVGLVLQANKRDAPDIVAAEDMRQALIRIAPVAVVPSTATTGDGIREAFVLAVRLALDRVRALAQDGRLRFGKPDEDDAQALLTHLQAHEGSVSEPVADALVRSVTESLQAEQPPEPSTSSAQTSRTRAEKPFVPDPMMPGGMIWPPVDGRVLLHEVAALGIATTRTTNNDWAGASSGFRFHSFAAAIFSDPSEARTELLDWARLHSVNTAHLSAGRAVILADAGSGQLRLWQIIRSEATLRERLATALLLSNPIQVVNELVSVATQLALAREAFATATVALPCTLWTVGAGNTYRPAFVALMPDRRHPPSPEAGGSALLKRELAPALRELRRARVDYADMVTHLVSLAETSGRETATRWLAEIALAT